jgi:integrase
MPRKYQNPKLEIRQDVKRAFYYVRIAVPVITANGRCSRRVARNLGFVDQISKKEAMKRRAEVLELANAGKVVVQSQYFFKHVAQRFLDIRVPQLGFATQNKYRTQIKNHILPAFGELRMCDIDRPAVEEWLTGKATELSWWSRIDLKGTLSAIFTMARNWKLWSGDNPTEGVRVGRKILVREKRLLTVDQMRSILAALEDRERFLVLILLSTGIRISEALGLRWADINFDKGTLEIKRRWYRGDLSEEGCVKTENSVRNIQLGPLVSEFARRYPGPQASADFVFIGDDGVMPPDDRDLLRYEFRPALKRLKLYYTGFGWHAFRRQNVTWRQSVGGAMPLEAQKAAGHGSLEMTYLYTLVDGEREKSQVQAIFDHVMGTNLGKPQ